MSTHSGTQDGVSNSEGFNKTAWQREYMRERLKDPEFRAQCNEYQRAYHKNKRATDPEYQERRKASKQKYLSKLRALKRPLSN